MTRRILFVSTLMLAFASTAMAQGRVEISGWGGYSFSEGINVNPNSAGGILVSELHPTSGLSYGASFNVAIDDDGAMMVGFLWGQQESNLEIKGAGGLGKTEITEMDVRSYHGIFTYNFGDYRDSMRPYVFGGIGATQYSPGDIMQFSVDGETKFSSTWGGGVKFFANDNVGINVGARWTPTYIKSDPAGIWCSPYWTGGCWQLSDPDYSNQLEFTGGITLRF